MSQMDPGSGPGDVSNPPFANEPGASSLSDGTGSAKDARLWATLCHLSTLAGFFVPGASIVAPLVIWMLKKEQYPEVDHHGKESLNFQITVLIAAIVCVPLMFLCIGVPLAIAVGVLDLIYVIIASIKANEGVPYRYPFTLRLVK